MRIDAAYIARMSEEIRAHLGEDFDAETFLDTLDGETDALDLADRMIADEAECAALVEAIRAQEAALKLRRERMGFRRDAMRAQMLALLDAMGEKKLVRPGATISRRAGSVGVEIVNEADIPSQLLTVKTTTAPDKKAIRDQLEAGEDVPGARLTRGPDGVTVRVV